MCIHSRPRSSHPPSNCEGEGDAKLTEETFSVMHMQPMPMYAVRPSDMSAAQYNVFFARNETSREIHSGDLGRGVRSISNNKLS